MVSPSGVTSAQSPSLHLHQLFESRVEVAAEEAAVIFGSETLTYRQVEERANRIANALIQMGVCLDEPVGICVDRSLNLIPGLLGILKAGGAYMPIDSEMPKHRISQMLEQAGASLCLTERKHQHLFADRIRTLDLDESEVNRFPSTRPCVPLDPENLVSVYFTSGSTGVPKGVGSTHAGWRNRIQVMQDTHGIKPGETVLHKTTLSFDDSALEIFWPLAFGGTVALIAPGLHRDPRAVLEAAKRHQTVLLQVVPSMLNALLDVVASEDATLPALRSVVSSGEALAPGTVDRFFRSMSATLYNTWGATEASIDSTSHICSPVDGRTEEAVCIGRPIPAHTVYILDASMEPVRQGEIGDLYIGGSGLARGYMSDPGKTAGSFVPDPFRSGQRMYRTGDRGYFDAEGNLHYSGRNDHQVKIRGMRVEFGEIESVFSLHPAVKEAVVDAHRAENGLVRLVAYITLIESPAAIEVVELRHHVAKYLPKYMHPSGIIVLDRFPTNSNGKIDRKRLVADLAPTFLDEEHTPPEGPVETEVASIWGDLLNLDQPSATQDFFHLGGQSLLGVTLASRIGQRFGVEVKLKDIYDFPTISLLSEHVSKLLGQKLSAMTEDELNELMEGLDE
ncbi:amino acid adenylation domain-containing protein [Streptomyces bikiniensis]|uniref:Amino acid adenylation domain-containing protein n=1 Tax=Streptomyces bikiniensis TaxID=1896 RepID=A0ABW8D3I6_STRBI